MLSIATFLCTLICCSICLSKLSRDYFDFFQEWFTNFHNPITIVCFEEMVQDPVTEVRRMLNFLEFPDYRKSQNSDMGWSGISGQYRIWRIR